MSNHLHARGGVDASIYTSQSLILPQIENSTIPRVRPLALDKGSLATLLRPIVGVLVPPRRMIFSHLSRSNYSICGVSSPCLDRKEVCDDGAADI
jgi:hypothetical protein